MQANRITRDCLNCGSSFQPDPSNVKRGKGWYCSKSCRAKHKTGAAAPRWNGGRTTTPNGYIRITLPGGGWMYEHRFVMEQHLGRKLDTSEHVHHRNGDPTDNRIENLEVLTAAEHNALHEVSERIRPFMEPIQGWSRDYSACVMCGTTDSPYAANGLCSRCRARKRRQIAH